MELPKRKPNRLPLFDYNTPGAYFITICVENRKCILGSVVGGGDHDAPQVSLSRMGEIVRHNVESSRQIANIRVDKYVIMPNHIHLILFVDAADPCGPSKSPASANAVVPHYVSTLKRFCHKEIGEIIFQRSYHDHVIRGEKDYLRIWEYIDNNPARWNEDCFYIKENRS